MFGRGLPAPGRLSKAPCSWAIRICDSIHDSQLVPGGLRCVMVSLLGRAVMYHPIGEKEERQAAAMENTFATPRLKARKLAREDLPDLVQLHLDSEVSRFLGDVRTPSATA